MKLPVMIPSRSPKWENGACVKGHTLHSGPTITKLTETHVEGYFWAPGNAVFRVARNRYGFKVGGCGDAFYFSDIGKDVTLVDR